MKVLHLNAGNETGGGMHYLLRTLSLLNKTYENRFILGVMEKKTLYERAKIDGIPVVCFGSKYKYSVNNIINIIKFIKKNDITHVHTHGPRANVFMNIIKKFIKVKWIITLHSNPTVDFVDSRLRYYFYTNLHLHAMKKADFIISVSEKFHPILLEKGIPKANIFTVHNGIDFTKKRSIDEGEYNIYRKKFGFIKDEFLFVQVARLEKVKGHTYALLALRYLIEKGITYVHLLLIGDGTQYETLKAVCKSLKIEQYVHFYKEQPEVESFYLMADATLLTSVSESFPLVLLESAFYEKPVIATDVGDIRQLVANKEVGWLVQPRNIIELANAMEQAVILKHNDQLNRKGKNLYKHALENFSLQSSIAKLYQVYEQCK